MKSYNSSVGGTPNVVSKAFIEQGLNLSWEMVTLIICKDIVILALIGLVQFEKVSLKAGIGNV